MQISEEILKWLLETENPDTRYLTLKNLIGKKSSDRELINAKRAAIEEGMAGKILNSQSEEGYWFKPGPGYSPKYKSTVWSLITLAQLGMTVDDDPRIKKGCKYYIDNAYSEGGYFGYNGLPSGTIDCLQGNMCAALADMQCKDKRLGHAFDWMARSVTGEGVGSVGDTKMKRRYYSYKCGPLFACSINGKKSCAWGGVKVMYALSKLPESKRTKVINDAIRVGAEFLLDYDITTAVYPTKDNSPPSRNWKKFAFPVFYITDILQNVETLVNLGYKNHPNVQNAIDYILNKQNKDGTWNLEYSYKTWGNWGDTKESSKWVTYRVLNVLKK